ncbi:helix-turn-helix transcriptional regulator [Reyranella sp. MMS21-HV4-11]|uniref:Helix-turn-helix transcriptional regulator n=1 Tax=Reyranella humidisoli TaxID=2849149 RepID=A0ABS6INT4_9HYPH|nr:helix-turn-helix domain-containing protein [Reyranella sp. MMS21-HV4-11]MBU8874845.1 helix-turn-helix transcriptional regulator [Reyranella sp. MMS21-HV4-11]
MSTPTPATQTQAKESVTCPMDFILRMLMGPWTTYILYNLRTHGPQRFGELKRRVSGISAKMLTERLRTLEGAALVKRDYEATIPPKVTYSLTRRGGELDEVMDRLAEIAVRWEAEDAAQRAARAAEAKPPEKMGELRAAD